MGCHLSRPTPDTILCRGRLRPGEYSIAGNVSSQYITGLLFALSIMAGECRLNITGKIESAPYIAMTRDALSRFAAAPSSENGCPFSSPGYLCVEGDWSNGAFFLAAQALGSELSVRGLDPDSLQGDRAVSEILPALLSGCPSVSAADIPDLVPILSVVAAASHGAVFTDIGRLRLKESDRVASVIAMISALGGKAEATEDTLTIHGTGLRSGTVDACNDHRIAMSAAIAATVCTEPVTILGAECVEKSYPRFWEEYKSLGGNYELNLR